MTALIHGLCLFAVTQIKSSPEVVAGFGMVLK